MRSPDAPRRSRMSTILTASAATALATLPVLAPTATAAEGNPTDRVLQLTNDERAKAGCGALKRDATLDKVAQDYTASMQRSGKFSHTGADGSTFDQRQRRAGYDRPGGENIAQGQDSADEVVRDWMNSPGHRRNILDCTFTSIGLGAGGADEYWAQEFGR